MQNEADELRQYLKRYRFLLSGNTDPQVDRVIRELIAEAEARLRQLTRDQREDESDPRPRQKNGPALS